MMKEQNEKRKKKTATVGAAVLVAALALTGTFAWQSISQHALDENILDISAGGRVHDDWNGENKDVYAENYSSGENAKPLFVRIRLMEFMETGADAGDLNVDNDEDKNLVKTDRKPLVAGTFANKTDGWQIRKPTDTADKDEADASSGTKTYNPFLNYWDWTWGEGTSTVYMPTFNKNSKSLKVDVNGTYEGQNGTTEHYDDYVEYQLGEEKTATEYYYAKDQSNGGKDKDPSKNAIPGTEIDYYIEETGKTHTAAETDTTKQVLTMDEWVALGKPVGKYWVWDDDGWFYWAEPLYPGETTGLLLDEVQQKSYLSNTNYYGINVEGEFASKGDWGDKNVKTGFYYNNLSSKGEDLLNHIMKMVKGEDGDWYEHQGYNLYYKVDGSTGKADTSDLICAGADLSIGDVGDKSEEDKDVHHVKKIELDHDLIVSGINYGKIFLAPQDVNSRASVTEGEPYLAPGADQMFGTKDDLKVWYAGADFEHETNTELFSNLGMMIADANTKYLERIAPKNVYQKVTSATLGKYYWVGANGEIGTSNDKEAIHLNEDLVIQWDPDDDSTKTNYGKWFLLPAEDSNNAYVSIGTDGRFGTEDDVKVWYWGSDFPNGERTDFYAEGVGLSKEQKEQIAQITPGSASTVTIDNVAFYVLAKEEGRALLFTKGAVKIGMADDNLSISWKDSQIRKWLNGEWMDGMPTLEKDSVVPLTEIQTVLSEGGSDFYTTEDYAFLLSEADVFGQNNGTDISNKPVSDARYYTTGQRLTLSVGWKLSGYYWYFRSPNSNSSFWAYYSVNGFDSSNNSSYAISRSAIRPALWVKY